MHFEPYPFEKLNQLLADIVPNPDREPLNLTIGEPQFPTPQFILDAVQEHASLFNKYPKTAGAPFLREGMLQYMRQRFGVALDDAQMIPTFGTREVLFNFPQFLLDEIDNPVMAFPNPFYQIYEGAARVSGATVLYMHLTAENDFQPELNTEMLSRCDLVVLNSPDNPTASVLPYEAMIRWVRWALEYDFVLLNDECYADLYLGEPIPSLLNASIAAGNPDFRNVLIVNSISKRSSAPGLRSGFIAGDADILARYMTYRTYVGCAAPLPLQHAAAVAWADQEHVAHFRDAYRRNIALAQDILGVEPPDATFYIWMKMPDTLASVRALYREEHLKVLPGAFLGRQGAGEDYVRLALVYPEAPMRDALERLKRFINKETP